MEEKENIIQPVTEIEIPKSAMEQDPNFKKLNPSNKSKLIELRDAALSIGIHFMMSYEQIQHYKVKITGDEKLEPAFKYLFAGELLENVELGMSSWAPVLAIDNAIKAQEKDGAEIWMGVRELKMINEFIKSLKIKGKELIINVAKSIEVFGKIMVDLHTIEQESQKASQDMFQKSGDYVKLCQKRGVRADNIEKLYELHYAKAKLEGAKKDIAKMEVVKEETPKK